MFLLYPPYASSGYFGLALYTPASFKFTGCIHSEVSFSGIEIGLILKSKMATAGISLKSVYFFPLAVWRK